MSSFFAEPHAQEDAVENGQPCALDCAHARALRTDPFGDEWLWCAHPANATRLVHPHSPCVRYVPASDLLAVRQAGAPRTEW